MSPFIRRRGPSLADPPWPWSALVAFAAALAASSVGSTWLVYGVGQWRASRSSLSLAEEAQHFALSGSGLRAVASLNAFILVLLVLAVAWAEHLRASDLQLNGGRARPVDYAVVVGGMIGLSAALDAGADLFGVRGGSALDAIQTALARPTLEALGASVILLGIVPAIAEELFFRGLMQSRLIACWGSGPGVVVASLAFGLMHLDRVQGTLAFVAGLFLGWAAHRFSSIRVSMTAHAANNVLFVLLASCDSPVSGSRAWKGTECLLGVLAWGAAFAFCSRRPGAAKRHVNAQGAREGDPRQSVRRSLP